MNAEWAEGTLWIPPVWFKGVAVEARLYLRASSCQWVLTLPFAQSRNNLCGGTTRGPEMLQLARDAAVLAVSTRILSGQLTPR